MGSILLFLYFNIFLSRNVSEIIFLILIYFNIHFCILVYLSTKLKPLTTDIFELKYFLLSGKWCNSHEFL